MSAILRLRDENGVMIDVPAIQGENAYQVAVRRGFVGDEKKWVESLKGKSAYELAKDEGFEGTLEEWLESLKASGGSGDGSGANPLPEVSSSDNGCFLRVVDGVWAVSTIPSAEGASF